MCSVLYKILLPEVPLLLTDVLEKRCYIIVLARKKYFLGVVVKTKVVKCKKSISCFDLLLEYTIRKCIRGSKYIQNTFYYLLLYVIRDYRVFCTDIKTSHFTKVIIFLHFTFLSTLPYLKWTIDFSSHTFKALYAELSCKS